MKINTKKAIEFLLSHMYQSEFEVIDRLSQHPDGINFEKWLKSKKLTEDCRVAMLEKKAKKWDELDIKISRFYPDEDEQHNEPEGDLSDIGEVAASAFGYL